MRKRLLLITLEYPPVHGGVAEYYRGIVASLPSGSVDVFAPAGDLRFKIQDSRFEIRRQFFWKIWPRWGRLVVELVRLLRREHYDWIAIGQILPIGTAVVIAKFIARFTQKLPITNYQLLVFSHGMDIATLRGYKRLLARWILNRCDLVIANSQWTKGVILSLGIPGGKIHVLTPCPAHSADINDSPSEVEGRSPIILSVGRLVRRKGFDTVMRVFARVRTEFPEVQLVIIGDGPERGRLEELARDFGIAPSVTFLGNVSDAERTVQYQAASVFLLLPRDEGNGDVEGFGMVFLEANAFGVPVIAGRSGGVSEAIADGVTGYLVDPLDVESAAARVRSLLEDSSLRQRLGQQSRVRVREHFQWQTRADMLRKICDLG